MVEQDIPIVSQSGTYNYLPVSAEAVDKSFGGSITQDELRSLFGGNPNTDGISDVDFWNLYERLSGHEVLPDKFLNDYSATLAVDCMKNGGRVAVNLNTGGDVGHSVVLQQAIRKTVTKINGIPKESHYFYVMNPMRNNYVRISGKSISKAQNVFHIFP